MKPDWAKNVVTGLARVGGQPVGIVANQPMVLGGALDVNAADKAARFVWLCDAFGIPLVFLHDVPGFIVGSAVEKQGIIRHGAKMLFAVSEATVPKISVVLRKSYGAGYFVMNGTRVRGRLHRRLADRRDRGDGPRRHGQHHPCASSSRRSPRARSATQARIELAEEIRKNIDPYIAAGHAAGRRRHRPGRHPPRDLERPPGRRATKHVDRPWRKHGVLPV